DVAVLVAGCGLGSARVSIHGPKLAAAGTMPAGGRAVITFEHVTKRDPGGTVAGDALDLTVPAGTTMVLVGPSGCGKTTSLRMINRMVEPTSGRITVDGRDVLEQNPAQLRRG